MEKIKITFVRGKVLKFSKRFGENDFLTTKF